MKSVIGILVLVLSCQLCFGQVLTRKTLHGKVVNDSIAIENGLVFNLNAKTGASEHTYYLTLTNIEFSLVGVENE